MTSCVAQTDNSTFSVLAEIVDGGRRSHRCERLSTWELKFAKAHSALRSRQSSRFDEQAPRRTPVERHQSRQGLCLSWRLPKPSLCSLWSDVLVEIFLPPQGQHLHGTEPRRAFSRTEVIFSPPVRQHAGVTMVMLSDSERESTTMVSNWHQHGIATRKSGLSYENT